MITDGNEPELLIDSSGEEKQTSSTSGNHPPYPFHDGASLLALIYVTRIPL